MRVRVSLTGPDGQYSTRRHFDVEKWLLENLGPGIWGPVGHLPSHRWNGKTYNPDTGTVVVGFPSRDDALLFKLTWGGK